MNIIRIVLFTWARYWSDVLDSIAEALDPFDPFDKEDD